MLILMVTLISFIKTSLFIIGSEVKKKTSLRKWKERKKEDGKEKKKLAQVYV